jgi:acrylyl-CoA reductase (NADPH)
MATFLFAGGAMPTGIPESFKAFVVREGPSGRSAGFETLSPKDLPDGDLLVAVHWSSLNYKDGLAVTGKGKVIRRFPMVPGIDLAGTVLESKAPAFAPGDEVLVTGCGLGEASFGGYAGLARVKAEWALPLPAGLTARGGRWPSAPPASPRRSAWTRSGTRASALEVARSW